MSAPLADVQARFHGYVTGDAPAPLAQVRGNDRAPAETLIGVYRNNYRQGLTEALEADYQALYALLGDDAFREMAAAYIAAEPSRHYSIRWFGAGLARFLSDTAPWRERTELAELARWEWALGEAADAADADAIDAAVFAGIAPDAWAGLRLRFHPSLRRLDLAFAVPQWRFAVENEESDPPAPAEAEGAPVAWAIWRDGVTILYRSLAEGEAPALDAAKEGIAFGALCEALVPTLGEDAAAHAAGFLRSWVGHGWITAVET